MTGHEILLKPENLQVTGSFKIRGAYNKIASLTEEQIAHGIVTASAGNHAQGVAYAARERGAKATICMPQITPPLKVDATKEMCIRDRDNSITPQEFTKNVQAQYDKEAKQ